MTIVVAVLIVWAAAAAGPSPAGSIAFTYDQELSWWAVNSLEVASQYSGSEVKRIPYRTYIKCYANAAAFEEPLIRDGATLSRARATIAYWAGKGEVHVRNGTCMNARKFTTGLASVQTAGAFATILHETLHRQGLVNERAAECYANDSVKYAGWMAHWNSLADVNEPLRVSCRLFGLSLGLLA